MKKLLSVAAGALLLASCGSNGKYSVTAQLPDESLDGETVYLYNLQGSEKLDSAVVVKNTLKFEGSVEKPVLANIIVGNHFGSLILLENAAIEANVESGQVSGTKLNEALTAFVVKVKALNDEAMSYQQELMANASENPAELQKLMMDKINNELLPRMKDESIILFNENSNNQLGLYALMMLQGVAPEEIEALLPLVGPNIENEEEIKSLKTQFASEAATKEGALFTDFEATDENGNVQKLSDYVGKGKYVLVDFWASWCGPCKAEIPNLKEIYKKYKGDNFELLGVAVWDKQVDSEKAVEEEGMDWPQILNTQKIATDAYAIQGIPMIILFGPDGTIVKKGLRGSAIGETLEELLK